MRSKTSDATRLTVVPAHGAETADSPTPAVPGQIDDRGPSPRPTATHTEKPKTGLLAANRKGILIGVAAVALLAAGWFGFDYMSTGRFLVSTDDAYVRAYNTTLGAKVSGYLSAFLVDDNTKVHAGDVVARIDDGDYRLSVNSARDKVATQEATIARFDPQIAAQRAAVEQAKAQLISVQAAQIRMQSEYDRQLALAGKEFASKQTLEQSLANRDQANAAVQSAQAALANAVANVGVLEAQKKEAERTLDELKTALAKAERDLSFTDIRAPFDGVVGNRAAQVGDFVQTGQRIAALVPLSDVFIDANFKETQLAHLRPGQPVSISVDALPDETLQGVVASVSPASGSVFTLLPPDNATGNFTKIVQRLSVRIQVSADVAERGALRPGMSVVVSVNTKPGAVAWVPQRTMTAEN
ncbi:MAG: HlyD family secretion protein [Bradyrhizobiaceae bacterium]|nr:HlyD family secretion protein [Bradyrhizobiaceae bacterium]